MKQTPPNGLHAEGGYARQPVAAPAVIVRLAFVAAVVALACCACSRGSYPAPPRSLVGLNEPPGPIALDPGSPERVKEMEGQCRVRLSGDTADASLAALDRVHEVLGAGCDLRTVDRDPLHWLLHCRSDALFKSGEYHLSSSKQPCPELKNRRVAPWTCVGAVLQQLFELQGGGALERLGVAVVGHVDMQPIKPSSESHLCTELQGAFAYEPTPAWVPVPPEAEEEERQHANHQLAWCRAASVGHHIQLGMEAGSTGKKRGGDGRPPVELAVLGMGTSWLRSQPDGACPDHGMPWWERKECRDARRVDLLARFEPRAQTAESTCDKPGQDPASTLYCLQDCSEAAAVGAEVGTGIGADTAPLFVYGAAPEKALPSGWYLKRMPESPTRHLDLGRICETLGIRPGAEAPEAPADDAESEEGEAPQDEADDGEAPEADDGEAPEADEGEAPQDKAPKAGVKDGEAEEAEATEAASSEANR